MKLFCPTLSSTSLVERLSVVTSLAEIVKPWFHMWISFALLLLTISSTEANKKATGISPIPPYQLLLPLNTPSSSSSLFSPSSQPAKLPISPSPSLSTSPSQKFRSSPLPSSKPSSSSSSLPSLLYPFQQPIASTKPSLLPSVRPTSSQIPTWSPTWSPTLSNNTTTSLKEVDFIGIDEYGRRYFPFFPVTTTNKSYSYQQVPNCTLAADNPGCISVPRSILYDPPHRAVGKLYATPPSCNERNKQCDQGVPVSQKSHSLTENPSPILEGIIERMSPVDLSAGYSYRTKTIAAVDVNGDGMLDILLGNQNRNNQLLMNNGNGTYAEAIDLPGFSTGVSSILAADVNNDGMVDIIIGNIGTKNKLLLNDGNGTFSEAIDLPGGRMKTESITAADINGDGRLDIIVGNHIQKNQLLLNDGRGSFSVAIDLPGDNSRTRSIIAADVNNDGMQDIIIGNDGRSNELLLNHGNGRYSDVIALSNGLFGTKSLAAADVDGDGMVDILVGNYGQKNQILFNEGNGSYSVAMYLPGGEMDTFSVGAADLNGDGMLDILIGNYGQNNQLLLNDGDGSYSEAVDLPGGDMETYSITAADVNNDGIVDIFMGNGRRQSNILLLNMVDATNFREVVDLPSSDNVETYCLAVADVNNDGKVDIIIGYSNWYQSNHILLNDGDGSYYEAVDLPDSKFSTRAIAVADVDGDGMVDIIFGNDGVLSYESNQLLLNNGNGTYLEAMNLTGGYMDTNSITVADMNGDGMVDILIGNYGQNNQLLLNDGDGNYSQAIDLPGGDMETRCIAVADVNNDDMLDILISNNDGNNQLVLNEGDGHFSDATDLPGGAWKTRSIVAADVNNDGLMDILLGNLNHHENFQLLMNDGDGNFSEALNLPVAIPGIYSIAVADINGDGMVDIVLGTSNENKLLMNDGNGYFFEAISLPGSIFRTRAVAIADVNSDGMLDILTGNENNKNQLILYDSCPDGGAQLHSKSWCFRCPSFMGRDSSLTGLRNYMCRECMPDYVQQVGDSEQCEPDFKCFLGQRKFGEDSCSECPSGTYYSNQISRLINDPFSWNRERCVTCPNGSYTPNDLVAIDTCFQCTPGTYQPNIGSDHCLACSRGSFQPDFGKDHCKRCSKGGYCNAAQKIDGGFTACPPGTYNDKRGQNSIAACIKCPPGTYSTENGAKRPTTCLPCPSGTYNNQSGQISCKACDEGTFQDKEGQLSCIECPVGSFTDTTSSKKCTKCPYRLASANGSTTCPFCAEGFYLDDSLTIGEMSDIFQDPFKYCLDCPSFGASCHTNSSLSHLYVQPGYWRHSNRTSIVYTCNDNSDICSSFDKTNSLTNILESRQNGVFSDIYCKEGHQGPLCQVCSNEDHYFDDEDGHCKECPSLKSGLLLLFIICLTAVVLNAVITIIMSRKGVLEFYINLVASLNLEAKLKLVVSFFQIMGSLEDVYGVKLDSSLTAWTNALFKYLSLDLPNIIGFPTSCIGSTRQQLLVGALWPYMIVLVGAIGQALHRVYKVINCRSQDSIEYISITSHMKSWLIEWTIVIFYFALPTVSNGLFDAIKCRAFDDDDQGSFVSYLIIDMAVQCESSKDLMYRNILKIFWVLIVIWVVLTPLGFFTLLARIYEAVNSLKITSLANTCRFLWQDYDPSMIYWDVVDTLRKIFLTGCIMFIDLQEGSNKILRLAIAIVVSVLYTCVLLTFNPYKRKDNFYLASLSNFLLICCFSLGIILKSCDEENNYVSNIGLCASFIGMSLNAYQASILVVILMLGLLMLILCLMIALAIKKAKEPVAYMASTRYTPNLELPEECSYHMFMSHAWRTGQAQTHAIVHKMQLFMPGLKVWLDVDELTDVSNLEDSVSDAAVFVIYYSSGYFRSKNCRRELYAAIKLEKPIIVIYKGDSKSTMEEMIEECINYCNDHNSPGSAFILERIFGDRQFEFVTSILEQGPIQWLNGFGFSAMSLVIIYYRILRNLPYYRSNPDELTNKGIMVPGELKIVLLQTPINVLVCDSNNGCLDIAEELKDMVAARSDETVFVYDAAEYLNDNYHQIGDDLIEIGEDGNVRGSLMSQSHLGHRPTFLLLLLNELTFGQSNESDAEMEMVITSCINDPNIHLVLVHEQDAFKGACDFNEFFKVTPQKLMDEPYNLYREIAIPLHSMKEYRTVSLKLILNKMVTLNPKLAQSSISYNRGSLIGSIHQLKRGILRMSSIKRPDRFSM